ncbi:hypothetical protein ACLOJK_025251 [Asimina triloba]
MAVYVVESLLGCTLSSPLSYVHFIYVFVFFRERATDMRILVEDRVGPTFIENQKSRTEYFWCFACTETERGTGLGGRQEGCLVDAEQRVCPTGARLCLTNGQLPGFRMVKIDPND